MTSVSSGSGANSTRAQSGAAPSGSPNPPQPAPGLWASTGPPPGYARRSASNAHLGVGVGAVLGEDRQDQLARRVQAALPGRAAVARGEAVEHERHEPRPIALEPLRVARAGVGELALLRARRRLALPALDAITGGPTSLASRSPQRSSGAVPAAIAASTVWGRSATGTATAPTAASAAMPSASTPPPTAMHGTPAACARRATPSAVLPKPVCASIRPSPVMTRSARCELRVEVGGVHDEVDARPQRERAEAVLDREQRVADAAGRAGARGRRARAGRPRRPARRPTGRAGGRGRDVAPAWRPSAGRRRRRRRSVRSSGFVTSQATCRSTVARRDRGR